MAIECRDLRLVLGLATTIAIMYLSSTLFPRSIQANVQATRASRAAAAASQPPPAGGGNCRAAIFNNLPWHIDVMMGLAHAAQRAGCAPDVYFGAPKRMAEIDSDWGMRAVVAPWLPGGWRRPEELLPRLAEYRLVVFVTFPDVHVPQLKGLLEAGLAPGARAAQRFLLTVHNPPKLRLAGVREVLARWAPALGYATLAPFVSATTVGTLQALEVPVAEALPWLVPVFPLPPPPPPPTAWRWPFTRSSSSGSKGAPGSGPALCIQGGISQARRDYLAAFAAAAERREELAARGAYLLLLGSPDPMDPLEIPGDVADMVVVREKLPFGAYYAALSRCAAVLTAFASDRYLVDTASSTIAMAVNVGRPLLSEARLLEAYTFLDPDSVFVFDPGQPGSYGAAMVRAVEEGLAGPAAAAMARSKAAMAEHGVGVLRAALGRGSSEEQRRDGAAPAAPVLK